MFTPDVELQVRHRQNWPKIYISSLMHLGHWDTFDKWKFAVFWGWLSLFETDRHHFTRGKGHVLTNVFEALNPKVPNVSSLFIQVNCSAGRARATSCQMRGARSVHSTVSLNPWSHLNHRISAGTTLACYIQQKDCWIVTSFQVSNASSRGFPLFSQLNSPETAWISDDFPSTSSIIQLICFCSNMFKFGGGHFIANSMLSTVFLGVL